MTGEENKWCEGSIKVFNPERGNRDGTTYYLIYKEENWYWEC